MGCFNKTSFYSHLPITYDDDIVMFVFSNQFSISQVGCTPINPNGKGYTPICTPFFGKYDDYGSIKDVVDDANHQLFTKKIGMTLEKFCEIMHDLGGITIKELKDGIEDLKASDDNKNEYHHTTVEDYEALLKIYETVFKSSFPIYKEFGDDEVSKKYAEKIYQYELKRYDNLSLSVAMEHKSIYDKMIETAKETYFEGWYGKKVTVEDAFNNTVEALKGNENDILKSFFSSINPLKYGTLGAHEKMEDFIGIKACIGDTVYFDNADYCLYDNLAIDEFINIKENIINYLYFLRAFKETCTTFDVSPYHSQTVSYDVLIPIYEKMLNILTEKSKI